MNIIITGASRGIGYAIARKLSQDNSHKLVLISRSKEKLQSLLTLNHDVDKRIYSIVFDLETTDNYNDYLIPEIKKYFDKVDIIINNAGFLINKPLIDLSDDEINRMVNVNLIAPAKLIKSIFPFMNKPSHIVNIGSMGGFQGSQKFSGLSMYSATKAGLASLTECLAEEFKGSGVSINCLALGATNTEMLNEAFPGYKAPQNATDMADFIIDFALTKSKFINGKIIPVTTSTP